jgi:hypothetical protein
MTFVTGVRPSVSNQYIKILLFAAGCGITWNFYLSHFNHVFSPSFKVHISYPYAKEFCLYQVGSKPTTPNLYVYFWFWLSPPWPSSRLVKGEVVLSDIREVPCSIMVRRSWYSNSLWAGRSEDRNPVGRDVPHPSKLALGAQSASYAMGTGSFPGVNRSGRGIDYLPPYSAKGKERVELYLYSPFGLHGLFQGQLYRYPCSIPFHETYYPHWGFPWFSSSLQPLSNIL